MKKIALLLVVVLSLLRIGKLSAQEALPSFVANELDAYTEEAMKKWDIPGVAICIVKGDKVVYMKGFGQRGLEEKAKVDENTLFMIASNSKSFTATALCMLANEGKCRLQDKVVNVLPDFHMNSFWEKEIDMRDLMTHHLGLKTFQGDFMYFYSDLEKAEVYEKFARLVPDQEFRVDYGYCNAGYFFAGQCIEKISGKKWEDVLQEKIFGPLKMNRTRALSSGLGTVENVAWGNTFENGKMTQFPHVNIDVIGPAAGISTSVNDVSHWLIAQLNNGMYEGKQVIPSAVLEMTRSPQVLVGPGSHPFNSSHFELYGLGWSLEDYDGHEVISHGGGIRGFYTAIAMVPEEKLGIAVFTNTDENWFYEGVKWEILDAYLGLPFRNYSNIYFDSYKRRADKTKQQISVWRDSLALKLPMSMELDAFVGQYQNAAYGTINIAKQGNALQLTFEHHPDLTALLEPLAGLRFLCTYTPSRFGVRVIPFRAMDGKITGLTLGVADRLEKTTYDFVKE